jgi:hypothetical protein
MIPALLLAAASLAAGSARADGKAEISSDITVHSKAVGPGFVVPPPTAARPVIDEVLDSLSLGRGAPGAEAETVRVEPDAERVAGLFPEPPFLAFSPANVRARYDSWTFEVLDDARSVWSIDGVGPARESLAWDGRGTDGRFAACAGKRYRYRFTGRRGGKNFAVESEPIELKSFARREYDGQTRLEVGAAQLFEPGRGALAPGADRYLSELASRLRAADPREDGTYRVELYAPAPRGRLAKARAKAAADALGAALRAEAGAVNVTLLPAERGESLAVFLPVQKGPAFRRE